MSPTPSSTASESQPHTPAVSGLDAFSWPTHSHYEENRLLLGTEEESSERQTSDEDEALAVSVMDSVVVVRVHLHMPSQIPPSDG